MPGATGFAHLCKSPDGVVSTTFKAAAMKLGLLDTDEEWHECLFEAATSFMAKQLWSLFVTILIFGEPAKPLELWLKYKDSMGEDILQDASVQREGLKHVQLSMQNVLHSVDNTVLLFLWDELEQMGSCLENFNLPTPDNHNRVSRIPQVIQDEMFDTVLQKL